MGCSRRRRFPPQTIDERQDRTIAIVQTAAAVALEIVVIGPTDIGVRVHGRNVGPHIVGIVARSAGNSGAPPNATFSARLRSPRMSYVVSSGGRRRSSATNPAA